MELLQPQLGIVGSFSAQSPYNRDSGTNREQGKRIKGTALIGNLPWNIFFISPRGGLQKHLAIRKTSSTASSLCYFYFSHTYTHSLGLTSRHSASWNSSLIVRTVFLLLVVIVFTAATTSALVLLLLFFNPVQCAVLLSTDRGDFAAIVCFQTCEHRVLAHPRDTSGVILVTPIHQH